MVISVKTSRVGVAVPGVGTVTLSRLDDTTEAVQLALKTRMSVKEIEASKGTYTRSDRKWHIPVDNVTSDPLIGETIEQGADVWTILDVEKLAIDEEYVCVSRQVKIEPQTAVDLILSRPTWKDDGRGSPKIVWVVIDTFSCSVSEIESKVQIKFDRRVVTVTHKIAFNPGTTDLKFFHAGVKCVEKTGAGKIYNVARVGAKNILGHLIELDATTAEFPISPSG